jgi:two-component system, NarL family, sensor kinase
MIFFIFIRFIYTLDLTQIIEMKVKRSLIILLCFFVLACQNEQNKTISNPDKGVTADMLPIHIKSLYNVSAGDSAPYHEHARSMYLKYLNQKEADSALFCLIAWHEVLDQNYIYDSMAMYWAVEHLKNGLGSDQNQQEIMKLGYYIGSMYYTTNQYDSCIYWLSYTLNNPLSLGRTKTICRTMMANTYSNMNKLDSSILLKQENLAYYKNLNDSQNYSITLSNLGETYGYIYAVELAEKYYLEALNIAEIRHDTFSQIMINHALLRALMEYDTRNEEIKNTVHKINELSNNYSKLNLNLRYTQALSNLKLYSLIKNLDSMEVWLSKFKYTCEKRGGESLNDYLFNLQRFEMYKGKPLSEKNWLLEVSKESYQHEEFKEAYGGYYILLQDALRAKKLDEALVYREKLNDINEQLFAASNNGKLHELEVKYQTQLKEQEILLKSHEIKEKQQKISWLILGIILLSSILFSYILWQQGKTLKLKKQQEETYSLQLLEETEQERKRIAQDLHDSVGHDLLNLKNMVSNKLSLTENSIDEIINEVREISRNLFPVMFEEVGLSASLIQLVEKIAHTEKLYVITEIDYPKNTLQTKQELLLYRIIQEALSNTIKYANAQSAKVVLMTDGNNLNLTIIDNGKGFEFAKTIESGKAFGLISIQKRAELLGAHFEISSNVEGTNIQLIIPIPNEKAKKA